MPATILVSEVNSVALHCLVSPGDGCQVSSAKSRMHLSQSVAVGVALIVYEFNVDEQLTVCLGILM
jgi:hypothetical protein